MTFGDATGDIWSSFETLCSLEVDDEETKTKTEKTAKAAEKQATKMTRKAAKAAAKAEIATQQAEASGAIQEDSEEN